MSVLPNFGPYEDAMSSKSRGLFHSRLATLLNLGRLMPQTVLKRALATEAPINSTEGFVRQLIWREYVHIHEITDGFRTWKSKEAQTKGEMLDGGMNYQKRRKMKTIQTISDKNDRCHRCFGVQNPDSPA